MRYLALVALVTAAACVAPTPETSDPGDPAQDPGGTPPPSGGSGGSGTTACVQAATPPGSGHHNAGANCQSCHTGNGAPLWTAAGTLYSSGGAAVAGATITIVDATGKSIAIVTAQNGNFWTGEAVTAPLHVRASRCPNTASMSMNANGACNSCHTSSASPGRIELP